MLSRSRTALWMLAISLSLHVLLWHGLHMLKITPFSPPMPRTLQLHLAIPHPPSLSVRLPRPAPLVPPKTPPPRPSQKSPNHRRFHKNTNQNTTNKQTTSRAKTTRTKAIRPSPTQKKPPLHRQAHPVQKQPSVESYHQLQLPSSTQKISVHPSFETLQQLPHHKHTPPNKHSSKQPWAGTDRFSRRMQAYHQRWKEQNDARVGLTDHFLSKASTLVDRCLEAWFYDSFKKTVESLGSLAPFHSWEGRFVITWDANHKTRTQLVFSKGLRMIDQALLNKATQCSKQIQLPKRLHGKYVTLTLQTTGKAVRNYALHKLVGIEEERNPHTQQMEYNFTHIGKLHISANTLFLRGSIRKNSFPTDLAR